MLNYQIKIYHAVAYSPKTHTFAYMHTHTSTNKYTPQAHHAHTHARKCIHTQKELISIISPGWTNTHYIDPDRPWTHRDQPSFALRVQGKLNACDATPDRKTKIFISGLFKIKYGFLAHTF